MSFGRRWIAVSLASLLLACESGDVEAGAVSGEPTEVSYAPELGVSLDQMTRTSSGLYLRDLSEGEGEAAQPGDQVTVHYTGWLPDGEQFDSSRDLGEPFTFTLGSGEVIQAWEEGVQGMRVGGQRRLVVPPSLGYGDSGAGGVIPPNATLVFDVELLQVR